MSQSVWAEASPGPESGASASRPGLHAAGFSLQVADQAWNALDGHIYGRTLQELNFPFEPDQYPVVAAGYLPTLSATQFRSLHALTSLVVARKYDGRHDFAFGLDLLLDGLERLLARRSGPE